MKFFFAVCCLLFAVCYLGGCISLDSSEKRDEVAEMRSSISEEMIKTKQDVNSLKGKIDELEYKIDKIYQSQSQQKNEINTTLKDWRKDTQDDTGKKVSSVESRLQQIENKQAHDKRELQEKINIVVDEVSRENKDLRRQIDSLKKTPPARGGYYTVAQGDTLLKISQETGSSMKNIMEVNNITDPNSIHIGQKLILPEKK